MRKLFLLFCLSPLLSLACFNTYYGIGKDGKFHEMNDIMRGFNQNFNPSLNERKLKKSLRQLKSTGDYKHLSDYAIYLLNLGKRKEPLKIFQELQKKHPNEYALASNLGTAYELNGEVDSALKYIKLGLKINPKSHGGSEWVHVRILEAKIKLKTNPNYLDSISPLHLTPQEIASDTIRKQIHIQLRERFPFTPPGNHMMAKMLEDLGDCFAATHSLMYAHALYSIAKGYHGNRKDTKLLEKRKAVFKRMRKEHDENKKKNVTLPQGGMDEQTASIGFITPKQIMDNNNKSNYKVDWTKIETTPSTLLALVK